MQRPAPQGGGCTWGLGPCLRLTAVVRTLGSEGAAQPAPSRGELLRSSWASLRGSGAPRRHPAGELSEGTQTGDRASGYHPSQGEHRPAPQPGVSLSLSAPVCKVGATATVPASCGGRQAQRPVSDTLRAAVNESQVRGQCKHPAWRC